MWKSCYLKFNIVVLKNMPRKAIIFKQYIWIIMSISSHIVSGNIFLLFKVKLKIVIEYSTISESSKRLEQEINSCNINIQLNSQNHISIKDVDQRKAEKFYAHSLLINWSIMARHGKSNILHTFFFLLQLIDILHNVIIFIVPTFSHEVLLIFQFW